MIYDIVLSRVYELRHDALHGLLLSSIVQVESDNSLTLQLVGLPYSLCSSRLAALCTWLQSVVTVRLFCYVGLRPTGTCTWLSG